MRREGEHSKTHVRVSTGTASWTTWDDRALGAGRFARARSVRSVGRGPEAHRTHHDVFVLPWGRAGPPYLQLPICAILSI